jgi:hypothetical protein
MYVYYLLFSLCQVVCSTDKDVLGMMSDVVLPRAKDVQSWV